MKQTSKYKLNQWDKTDRIQMEDFNADNGKVEAALAGLQQAVTDLNEVGAAEFAKRGNCQIWTTSYVGENGRSNITLTFPKKPTVVFIFGPDGYTLVTAPGVNPVYLNPSSVYAFQVNWAGNTMSWVPEAHGSDRLNGTGLTYQVVALLKADI